MNEFKEFKDATIRIITPTHIGCGDSYSSQEYIPKRMNIYIINISDLYRLYKEYSRRNTLKRSEFLKIYENGEVFTKEFKDWIVDNNKYERIITSSPSFNLTISSKMRSRRISKHINELGTPFIPGSSIKGALLTAYLNKVDGNKLVQKSHEVPNKWIRNCFVSDFYTLNPKTTVYPVEGALEDVVCAEFLDPGQEFKGKIRISKYLVSDIKEGAKILYKKYISYVEKRFNKKFDYKFKDNEIPLILGRFSGASSKVVHCRVHDFHHKEKLIDNNIIGLVALGVDDL